MIYLAELAGPTRAASVIPSHPIKHTLIESPENNSVGGKTVVNNYNSYDNFTVTINYFVEVEEGRLECVKT